MIRALGSLMAPLSLMVAAALTMAALACRRPRSARICAAACACACLVYLPCTPLFANWALGALEQRASRLRRCGAPPPGSAIIVLAGGVHGQPEGPDDVLGLSDSSIRRVVAATSLALATPGAELVVSGGAGGRWREADLMAALARRLGLSPARVVEDRGALTTYASALDLRRMLGGNTSARYLVTSAYHMPRALASFDAVGLDVCAWPVDFRAFTLEPWQMLLPQLTALEKSSLALHEWLGMIDYKWFKFGGEAMPARYRSR